VHAKRIAVGGPIPEEALRSREVVFQIDGAPVAVATRCYARARLKAGNVIAGPAIIEQMDSTTALPPGLSARVDAFGNLVIALG
jgi:N-methylhydantoinase A/oxoprolinase/acetone carboxylase beta subunit